MAAYKIDEERDGSVEYFLLIIDEPVGFIDSWKELECWLQKMDYLESHKYYLILFKIILSITIADSLSRSPLRFSTHLTHFRSFRKDESTLLNRLTVFLSSPKGFFLRIMKSLILLSLLDYYHPNPFKKLFLKIGSTSSSFFSLNSKFLFSTILMLELFSTFFSFLGSEGSLVADRLCLLLICMMSCGSNIFG